MLDRMRIAGCGVSLGAFADRNIPDREGYRYCILQIDQGSGQELQPEIDQILCACSSEFIFCSVACESPNEQLSPWKAPAVFKEPFGSGAKDFLAKLTGTVVPMIRDRYSLSDRTKYILAGYSFAGLFALWAVYETGFFHAAAGVSPSVWFPGWEEYIGARNIRAEKVYLSLGNKERKTRIGAMQKVEKNIILQHELVRRSLGSSNCCLEWNDGNHFQQPDLRMAKGISWILRQPAI